MLRTALAAAVSLSACARGAAPVQDPGDCEIPGPKGTIAGLVRDVASGSGVSFAAVEAVAADGTRTLDTTDGDGRFRLRLAPGRYRVSASYAGLRAEAPDLVVFDHRTLSVHLELDSRPPRTRAGGTSADGERATGAIAGRLITTEDGQPFPGAVVAAMSPELSDSPMAMSGSTGAFRLAGLPPGTYDLTVYYQLIDRGSIELRRSGVEVTAGQVTRVDLEIDLRVRR